MRLCNIELAIKPKLRETYLQQRLAVPETVRLQAAEAIAGHYMREVRLWMASSVSGYYPMRSELSPLPLLAEAQRIGQPTALPRIDPATKHLTFHRWNIGDTLVDGKYGIKEPGLEAEAIWPAIVIAPVLCFDAAGHRVGYGGGYFDRTLGWMRARNHAFIALGIAYGFQQTASLIATDDFDQRLDAVITEDGIVWF